jgi:hypothetical protein
MQLVKGNSMNKQAKGILIGATLICASLGAPRSVMAATDKIMAQKAIEELAAAHPEVAGLELAAVRSAKQSCRTIAATEPKEIGEKCDKDEFTAMRTDQAFVEQEKDGFDVTMPLHDSAGKLMGTVGMDFKREAEQTKASVTIKAKQIASELEKRLTSREQLFESVQ